jgi:hypothetical protein
MPLPQPEQSAGHDVFVSPVSHVPSPQYGPTTVSIVQLVVHVEHVFGGLAYAGVGHGVFVLLGPSSHCSPGSIAPLPHPEQSAGQLVWVSPSLHLPSPQYGPTTVLI